MQATKLRVFSLVLDVHDNASSVRTVGKALGMGLQIREGCQEKGRKCLRSLCFGEQGTEGPELAEAAQCGNDLTTCIVSPDIVLV